MTRWFPSMYVLDPMLPDLFILFFLRLQPSHSMALGMAGSVKDSEFYPPPFPTPLFIPF